MSQVPSAGMCKQHKQVVRSKAISAMLCKAGSCTTGYHSLQACP